MQLSPLRLNSCKRRNFLTSKACAPLQSLDKLRPHVDELVLTLLKLLSPVLHCLGDHGLDRDLVVGEEDITDPLLVQVVPVLLIRQVLEQGRLFPRMVEEGSNS